jgi:lipoprotein NlpI
MPGLLYERGQVLSDLNRPGEARKDFDEAIILGCANEQSYYGRGLAFLNEQSFSNAVSDLSIAITKRPDMAEAYFVRGIAFGRLGQLGLADKDIREAIRLNPSITNVFRMQ